MSKPQPQLRSVPGTGNVATDVAAAATSAIEAADQTASETQSTPETPAEPETTLDVDVWKRLGMELVIAAGGGASAGGIASASGRRPRGAAIGAGAGVGFWGLARGLFDRELTTAQRATLAIVGAASLGGSFYAAFRKGS